MKLTIVNAFDKNTQHIIYDTSKELNVPSYLNDKHFIIKNIFSLKSISISNKDFINEMPVDIRSYNLFLKNFVYSDEAVITNLTNKYESIFKDNFKCYLNCENNNLIKFENNENSFLIDKSMISSREMKFIIDTNDKFNNETISIMTGINADFYSKSYFNEISSINDLVKLKQIIYDKKAYILSGFITYLYDLNIPKIKKWDPISFDKDIDVDSFLNVPSINENDFKIDLSKSDKVKELENAKVNLNTESLQNDNDKLEMDLSLCLNDFNDLKNMKINRYSHIKFSPIDEDNREHLLIDNIFINEIESKDKIYNIINPEDKKNISYTLSGIVHTNPYSIRFEKTGFDDAEIVLRAKYQTDINNVDIFDLGNIPMKRIGNYISYTLTWGKFPLDLDFHVFSFEKLKDGNLNQIEHVYFYKRISNLSNIFLSYDDVTSFGPENVNIFNLDKKKYYLFSVHNFSRRSGKTIIENELVWDKDVKMTIYFKDKEINITPTISDKNLKKYWWDAFVIYDEKIYIIDKFESNLRPRIEDWNFNLNDLELDLLKNYLNEPKNTYSFEDLKLKDSKN